MADPLDNPCPYCGAEAQEPCLPDCLSDVENEDA